VGSNVAQPPGSSPYEQPLKLLLQAVQASPDHLVHRAADVVATKDATKIVEFVRDRIAVAPPAYGGSDASQHRRWGMAATKRAGLGNLRERADILADLLTQAGFTAEIYMCDRPASLTVETLYRASPAPLRPGAGPASEAGHRARGCARRRFGHRQPERRHGRAFRAVQALVGQRPGERPGRGQVDRGDFAQSALGTPVCGWPWPAGGVVTAINGVKGGFGCAAGVAEMAASSIMNTSGPRARSSLAMGIREKSACGGNECQRGQDRCRADHEQSADRRRQRESTDPAECCSRALADRPTRPRRRSARGLRR